MLMCGRAVVLSLLFCIVLACSAEDVGDDSALPAVNVRYEFAVQDVTGGGPHVNRLAELHGFKNRASHVLERVSETSHKLAEFASRATQNLDDLVEILGPPRTHFLTARASGQGAGLPISDTGDTDLLLDAQVQAEHMEKLKSDIRQLLPRLEAGGLKARDAMVRLISIVAQPTAKTTMALLGVKDAAAKLMKSPSSSEEIQHLAGSLLTLITDMPVTSEISDESSGSYGHVNIVLPRPSRIYRPDKTLIELESGVQPSETAAGGY